MGLECLDYDASVADFFIFYQIFSRAPRSHSVRVPNGMSDDVTIDVASST